MSSALFAYPKQAAFNRVLPKNKIYQYAKPSRSVQRCFVEEVNQIVWQYWDRRGFCRRAERVGEQRAAPASPLTFPSFFFP